MNDYIDRLIGRSMNKSHVIQPRLPAIFEPQTNDQTVFHKRKADIESSYHSSKEDILIAARPEPDRSELEEPAPSLNFVHAKIEYPEEFRNTI
ncbi:MAG: hypothetical protein MUO76_12900, partial [Anaerolineaceae bacterium]|nr:hypothetical protein [Anaerolineaceae bacterium]